MGILSSGVSCWHEYFPMEEEIAMPFTPSSQNIPRVFFIFLFSLWLTASGPLLNRAQGQNSTILYDTKSKFQRGVSAQTVLEGTEEKPEVKIAFYKEISWSFADTDFSSGWNSAKNGSSAIAEVTSGQIHLKAQRNSGGDESYSLLYRPIPLLDKFVVEYRIQFANLEPSGVMVPGDALKDQPTGACTRLDVFNSSRGGLRVDIFIDKIVSFRTRNQSIKDYPTTAFFNVTTEIGRWYTLRFECNFLDPQGKVQVYRDDTWIGELKEDSRNLWNGSNLRPMAYSRKIGSLAEVYIDHIKVGTKTSSLYSTGTYAPVEPLALVERCS